MALISGLAKTGLFIRELGVPATCVTDSLRCFHLARHADGIAPSEAGAHLFRHKNVRLAELDLRGSPGLGNPFGNQLLGTQRTTVYREVQTPYSGGPSRPRWIDRTEQMGLRRRRRRFESPRRRAETRSWEREGQEKEGSATAAQRQRRAGGPWGAERNDVRAGGAYRLFGDPDRRRYYCPPGHGGAGVKGSDEARLVPPHP